MKWISRVLAPHARTYAALAAIFLTGLSTDTFALAKPITVYQGTAGETPIEVILIHDWKWDGMSGYFISSLQNRPLPMEKVPYESGDGLLGVILAPPSLPGSALQLMPFALAQNEVEGRLIDLRTRSEQPVALTRATHFGMSTNDAYDGDLRQLHADPRFIYRVHARKQRDEYPGHVDRIDILDRQSGEVLQQLGDLKLVFFGMETLSLQDFNGDGVQDFVVTPLITRQSDGAIIGGDRQYFIHHPALGYQRHHQLEQLATKGHVRVRAKGTLEVRTGVDWDRRLDIWDRYVFDDNGTLQPTGRVELPFNE